MKIKINQVWSFPSAGLAEEKPRGVNFSKQKILFVDQYSITFTFSLYHSFNISETNK